MAEEKEKTPEEGGGKSKTLPLLLGIVLVVGAAVGVVAMTSPPAKQEGSAPLDLDSLPGTQWEEKLSWTFNPSSQRHVTKISIVFEYKAEDPLKATAAIQKGMYKAKSDIRLLCMSKTIEDLSTAEGAMQLKLEIQNALNQAFFPEDAKVNAKVSDVFFDEYLIK